MKRSTIVMWAVTNALIVIVGITFNCTIYCEENEELKVVEQYYKLREVDAPVSKGYNKGPTVPQPRSINLDKSDWFWRNPEHQHEAQVDQIVLPYEGFQYDPTKHLKQSYVIENKRFVEDLTSRCHASIVPEDVMANEPSFVIISSAGDIRVEATAPADLVKKAGFDPNKNTIIMVHGYTQSYPFSPYLRQMRDLIDKNNHIDSQNLIIIDYGSNSWHSYQQTAAMTSVIGSFLANFIMKLIELGATRKSIHLIGNSIGGHVAGFAGKRIQPPIGRITSLDTAGPCFGKWSTASSDFHHRLSVGDADEVVVFHYNDKFLGTPGLHGDVDIYVNNGSDQPGCKWTAGKMLSGLTSTLNKEDRYVETSHTRGQDLITAALPDWCQQVAYECASYESFAKGECGHCDDNNDQCYLMSMYFQFKRPIGTDLNPQLIGRRLFILTGPNSPYCSNHYQILVEFDPSFVEVAGPVRGASLELIGDNEQPLRIELTNQSAPNELSHLLLLDRAPVQFKTAKIRLQPSKNGSTLLRKHKIIVRVNFMSNIDPEVRRSFSSSLCLNPNLTEDGTQDGFFDLVQCK